MAVLWNLSNEKSSSDGKNSVSFILQNFSENLLFTKIDEEPICFFVNFGKKMNLTLLLPFCILHVGNVLGKNLAQITIWANSKLSPIT